MLILERVMIDRSTGQSTAIVSLAVSKDINKLMMYNHMTSKMPWDYKGTTLMTPKLATGFWQIRPILEC